METRLVECDKEIPPDGMGWGKFGPNLVWFENLTGRRLHAGETITLVKGRANWLSEDHNGALVGERGEPLAAIKAVPPSGAGINC